MKKKLNQRVLKIMVVMIKQRNLQQCRIAGLDSEEIYYTGFSEIEAYRTYKRIKGGKKNIFKAYIKRDLVFNVPFIDTYEIIEVIR